MNSTTQLYHLLRHIHCSLLFTACSLALFVLPAHGQPPVTDAEIIQEMSRRMVCFPGQRIIVDEPEITLESENICLSHIYHDTGPQPFWVTVDGPTPKAEIIFNHLRNSYKHGLNPADYNVDEIQSLWSSREAASLAQLETNLSYGLVKYAHDVSHGQLSPRKEHPDLFPEAGDRNFDPAISIQHILAANDLDSYLNGLPPQHAHYRQLVSALEYYRQLAAAGGWPELAEGESIRPDDRDQRIVTVRNRLAITGELASDVTVEEPELYTPECVEAVKLFQKHHGLTADGVIGKKTRAAMNVTAQQKVDIIRINLARWRWQAHELGAKHILVNIAAFNLRAYENGSETPTLDFPVIVGEEKHQTPVFSDAVVYLDFNPFWNITPSIAQNEELPALRKDSNHLVNRNVRLFSSWSNDAIELDSTTINWDNISQSTMRGFKLRQDPGPWNALGKVKFVFPNRYSVYMHDTASPGLFQRTQRNFSHGCIRISDPRALAIFLLEGQDGYWDQEKIMGVYDQTSRKTVRLTTPIPVHITYQTAWVDKNGVINFNTDIYGRDEKLFSALLK